MKKGIAPLDALVLLLQDSHGASDANWDTNSDWLGQEKEIVAKNEKLLLEFTDDFGCKKSCSGPFGVGIECRGYSFNVHALTRIDFRFLTYLSNFSISEWKRRGSIFLAKQNLVPFFFCVWNFAKVSLSPRCYESEKGKLMLILSIIEAMLPQANWKWTVKFQNFEYIYARDDGIEFSPTPFGMVEEHPKSLFAPDRQSKLAKIFEQYPSFKQETRNFRSKITPKICGLKSRSLRALRKAVPKFSKIIARFHAFHHRYHWFVFFHCVSLE